MARHGFGRGEYRYFDYPLPHSSAHCVNRSIRAPGAGGQPLARRHGDDRAFPGPASPISSPAATRRDREPTPLLLQYGAGDYNCLHQDLYGEHVFPLQVAVLLVRARPRLRGRRVRA